MIKFVKSQYIKSLLILTTGTFVAQLIPVIFYPIIGRLFSPEQIGSAAILSQIAAILAIIAAGGYSFAIFIAPTKEEAARILVSTVALSLAITILCSILLFFLKGYLSNLLSEPLIKSFFYFPSFSAFFIVIYLCYNEWCVKNGYFKRLSFNKLINSSSVSGIEAAIGTVNSSLCGNGILMGELSGRALSAISCAYSVLKSERKIIFENINKNLIVHTLKKYQTFPKYIMTGKLLNSVACALPVFYFGAVFSKEQLGFFTMANTVIAVPVSVVTLAVSDGFRERANRDFHETGSCRAIIVKTLIPLTLLSIVGFSILFIISPIFFEFILGKQWIGAGYYARYLIPMVAISFVTEIIRPVLIIADKKKYDFIWQILFIASMALLIAFKIDCAYLFLLLFTIVKSLLFILQFYWCYKYSIRK